MHRFVIFNFFRTIFPYKNLLKDSISLRRFERFMIFCTIIASVMTRCPFFLRKITNCLTIFIYLITHAYC
ncbi:hypothetical protein ACOME3_008168 [Neoechinorhynchus agilis]